MFGIRVDHGLLTRCSRSSQCRTGPQYSLYLTVSHIASSPSADSMCFGNHLLLGFEVENDKDLGFRLREGFIDDLRIVLLSKRTAAVDFLSFT